MMIFKYASKKELKENIGQTLKYEETSMFGPQYKANGEITGSNRPSVTGIKGREFFASVMMKDGLISKVS